MCPKSLQMSRRDMVFQVVSSEKKVLNKTIINVTYGLYRRRNKKRDINYGDTVIRIINLIFQLKIINLYYHGGAKVDLRGEKKEAHYYCK